MPEEDGLTVTPEAAPSPAATTTVPTTGSIIDKDGNLAPTWRDTLDEDIRNEKSLETFKTVKDIARSFVNTKRMVGKDKIAIPGKNATEGEWNAYYDAVGRPKTPEDYRLPIPEETKEYFDEELIKEARGIFHKMGFNQKQVDALWAFEQKRLVAGVKQVADEEIQKNEEAEILIDEIFGNAKEQSLHLANRVIAENYPNETRRGKLLEAINKSSAKPYIMELLSIVGKKFIEHGIPTDVPLPGQVSVEEMKSQLSEYMRTDAYLNRSNPDHKFALDKALRMREEINKMTARK